MPDRGLDLSCGVNSALAPYRSSDREVWGTDFQVHTQLCHPEWFRPLGREGEIPFPNEHFDLVAAIMVMEHVSDPDRFFREVARVLRTGGYFVGHKISASHDVTWIRRCLGVLPHRAKQWLVPTLYGRREEDTFPTHYRLNRLGQIRRVCRRSGLSDPMITQYADPYSFKFSRFLQVAAIVVDRLLEAVAGGWGRLYFTVRTRKVGPGGC